MTKSHRPRSKAQSVIIRFLDDEIMEGQVAKISLDEPNLVLEFPDGSNNERALIPLPSIKRVTVASGSPGAAGSGSEPKIAIRFADGEVLKGYLTGSLQHATHGFSLRLLTVERDRVDTLAIPYTAVKALFYVRSWDSRPPEFDGEVDAYVEKRLSSPLVDLVSNMGDLEKLRSRGAISEIEFQRKRRKILDLI